MKDFLRKMLAHIFHFFIVLLHSYANGKDRGKFKRAKSQLNNKKEDNINVDRN